MKKTVVLGVTGGIAAYKACEITSHLTKLGYDVKVIMTENAKKFVAPLTFETLSKNKVVSGVFEEDGNLDINHITYAKLADVFLIAPATANVIAKIAEGVADDMLTTTILATKATKIICPAMNTAMYENPIFLENLEKLKNLGYVILEPEEGLLACGDVGKGRLIEVSKIVDYVDKLLTPNPDLRGKTILVTAGATQEPIDSVRFITNHSSGKMGVYLAKAALSRGAKVILIHGKLQVDLPLGSENISIKTTKEMYDNVLGKLDLVDAVIKAAAPSDYRVNSYSAEKIKSNTLSLQLEKNVDIASEVGKVKGDKKLVIFAAETSRLVDNAKLKLEKKNADMVIANDITQDGAGFDVDTNIVTIIKKDGQLRNIEKMHKFKLANLILDELLQLF